MTCETRMDLCDPHPNLLKLKVARLRLDLSGHLAGTAARDLVRMGACLTVVEFLALLLLVPFYWPLIGLK
jgi:hypothetical protein